MSLIKWKKDELLPGFSSTWDDLFDRDFFSRGLELGTSIPAINVKENESSFSMEVAIPGRKKEDINIDLNGNTLTISSEKKEEKEEKDGEKVTRREFNYSSFQRSFQLPDNVKSDGINAEYKDGMLHISVPKTELAKAQVSKKIKVK